MSRKTIWTIVLLYFLLAVVLGVLLELATAGIADLRPAAIVGSLIGRIVAILALPAILPMLYWAFRRFRAEYAFGPLIIWGVLGLVFAVLSTIGDASDGTISFGRIPTNISAFSDSDYATFIRETKAACIQTASRQGGMTDEQSGNYCQCFAEGMLKEMTVAQFIESKNARGNVLPSWYRDIAVRVALGCRRMVLGQ
jgi:hypothetical protein